MAVEMEEETEVESRTEEETEAESTTDETPAVVMAEEAAANSWDATVRAPEMAEACSAAAEQTAKAEACSAGSARAAWLASPPAVAKMVENDHPVAGWTARCSGVVRCSGGTVRCPGEPIRCSG